MIFALFEMFLQKVDLQSWPNLRPWPKKPSLQVDVEHSLVDINYHRAGMQELAGLLLCAAIICAFIFGITGKFKTRKKMAVLVVGLLLGMGLLVWLLALNRLQVQLGGRWQSKKSWRKTLLRLWDS
jgi:hypothetical protein